jgi:hypothetical protein
MVLILYSFMFICQGLLSYFFYHTNFNIYLSIGGYSIFAIFLISYSATVFSNPGIPKKSTNFLSREKLNTLRNSRMSDGILTCTVCNVYVNQDVKIGHCLTCKVCILGYDHHCGWSSKCIGQGNLKTFWVFFLSVIIFFIYNLVCILLYNILDALSN